MIYFARITEGGPIKIGTTIDVERRMIELASRYGFAVELLRTEEGDREREVELHERFAHHRLGKTEQFRPAPDLLRYIGIPSSSEPDHGDILAIPRRGETVCLNVELPAELRRDLRIAALNENMNLKDWLPLFLRRHLGTGRGATSAQ